MVNTNFCFQGEWKSKSTMQQLCILRSIRPDRMLYALKYLIDL
jgi:dynein heavy chain